jgi:FAD-dependent urate hydroxylase
MSYPSSRPFGPSAVPRLPSATRALVIGGGVAGPAAAVALKAIGIDVELFESSEESRPSAGLFLTLAVNGLRALEQLNLLDGVLEQNPPPVPTPSLVFESSTGKTLGTVPNGWLDADTPSVTLPRSDLHEALLRQAARRGVRVHRGRRLVSAEETPSDVSARFDDGSEATADLLVGADGIRSVARKIVDPSAPAPCDTGLMNVGGMLAASPLEPTRGAMHMLWGRKAFFGHTVADDGRVLWFANASPPAGSGGEPAAAMSSSEWKAYLLELFADDPPVVARIIASTPRVGAWPIEELPELPTWHSRRMVLVGDAAHAVSPSTGQGASLAVEDAVVLARTLEDTDDLHTAFRRYTEERKPRTTRVLKVGQRRGAYKAPSNPVSLFLRDLCLPVALPIFANESRLAWLHDYEASR